jgi:hypothetical protein
VISSWINLLHNKAAKTSAITASVSPQDIAEEICKLSNIFARSLDYLSPVMTLAKAVSGVSPSESSGPDPDSCNLILQVHPIAKIAFASVTAVYEVRVKPFTR